MNHHVRLFGHLQRGYDEPISVRGLHIHDALAPARVMRYSASGVRLPKPFSATVSINVTAESLICRFRVPQDLRSRVVFLGDDLEVRLTASILTT